MVKDLLEERARELGLLFAWAPLDLPQEAEARHRAWLEAGRHGGMAYLEAPERFHPRKRFPWAKSALLLFAPYAYPDPGTPLGASGWAGSPATLGRGTTTWSWGRR